MLRNYIILILIILLIIAGVLYLSKSQYEETFEQHTEERAQEEEETEIRVEKEEKWETFENKEFSYTVQYKNDWETNFDDPERLWFYLPIEDVSILFASSTATQTGFPEYELLSSEEFVLNNNIESTISLLEDEDSKALISTFNTEEFPHFVMLTYGSEQLDEEMLELNKEFLSKITFQ